MPDVQPRPENRQQSATVRAKLSSARPCAGELLRLAELLKNTLQRFRSSRNGFRIGTSVSREEGQEDSSTLKYDACVNNCVHTLAVLVLCIFSTCRAFRHLEVFLSRCSFVKFYVHPCLFASRALELMLCAVSFDVIRCTLCSETVLRPSS